MQKRQIAIFTGNRAEYGLLKPIINAIDAHPDLEYQLIVSGAHLSDEYGSSIDEITDDAMRISAKIPLSPLDDSLLGTTKAIGEGVLKIADAYQELQPDICLIYADRYESLAALIASTQMGIPTAHIEGGDVTEGGTLDDSVRHAMSKLAHIHFPTNAESAWRLEQMGEETWRIFNTGLPSLDSIVSKNYASAEELVQKYKLDAKHPLIVFTQHSIATQHEAVLSQLQPSLDALQEISQQNLANIIITYPNNDAGGKQIYQFLENFIKDTDSNIVLQPSLGSYYYHGALAYIREFGGACVGNSSSGIKETPIFGCPTVNIGARQNGRLRSTNVLDVSNETDAIVNAIEQCINDQSFIKNCHHCENPYGDGHTGERIAKILAEIDVNAQLITKRMTLVP